MNTSTGQKVRIGIFTIAGILLFVAGIFFIGSKQNMFGDTYMIYGNFKNVGGLEKGNNIRFAGITVGTVEDIRIISDTLIRVDMLMQNQVKPFLKTDALATIGSDGLMGDKLITITSGSANEVRVLAGGSRIMTANPVDFNKIINKFTHVADNAETITQELAGMAIQIREGKGTISSLLYTDKLSKSLEGTAQNAEKITGSLNDIALQIKSGNGSVGNLVYRDSFTRSLQQTLATIQVAADGFSENMKALQGNYFLRGYYKRKARENNNREPASLPEPSNIGDDMTDQELKDLIDEAQKALDAKKLKK